MLVEIRSWYFQETPSYVYFGSIFDGLHFILRKADNPEVVSRMMLQSKPWRGKESLNFVCAKVRDQLRQQRPMVQ